MHDLPQFLVILAGSSSTNGLYHLHIRVQKAFAQHTLADHAGRAEEQKFIALSRPL